MKSNIQHFNNNIDFTIKNKPTRYVLIKFETKTNTQQFQNL